LMRNVELAKKAAYELSSTPWLRSKPEAKEAFGQIALDMALAMDKALELRSSFPEIPKEE
jgi:hypothetical protein